MKINKKEAGVGPFFEKYVPDESASQMPTGIFLDVNSISALGNILVLNICYCNSRHH